LVKDIEDLILYQDKKINDRANILIAAQSFLFGGIATLLRDMKLTSWHLMIPVIICLTGIGINIIWGRSNGKQMRKTNDTINKLSNQKKASAIFSILDTKKINNPKLTDFVSEWMPFVLAFGWIFTLIFYILYFAFPI
jgi:hypothetical protein